MFCRNCGGQMNDGADFCPHCGAKRNQTNGGNNAIDFSKFIKPLAIVVAAIFIIFFAFNFIGSLFGSEESRCVKSFNSAIEELKKGDITDLKKHINGENVGVIEELLQAFDISDDVTSRICKSFFGALSIKVNRVEKIGDGDYYLYTDVTLPNSSYFSKVASVMASKVDFSDIGVIFGRESKKLKIADKIVESFQEVDMRDYGTDSYEWRVQMTKINDKYMINNFSEIIDESKFGSLLSKIRPIIQFINGIMN